MSDKNGGPAFPRPSFAPNDVTYEDVGICDSQEGMSLRDYFAAKVMQGLVAGQTIPNQNDSLKTIWACRAAISYAMADAMLEARKQ